MPAPGSFIGVLVRRNDLIPEPDYELQIQERLTMMPRGFRLGLRLRQTIYGSLLISCAMG